MVFLGDLGREWDYSWLEKMDRASQEAGENENKRMHYNRTVLESAESEDEFEFKRSFKGNNDYESVYMRIMEE